MEAVEELTGRDVVAFMSNNHIDPDLAVEVFVLRPLAGGELDRLTAGADGHGPPVASDRPVAAVRQRPRFSARRPERLRRGRTPSRLGERHETLAILVPELQPHRAQAVAQRECRHVAKIGVSSWARCRL